MAYRPSGRSEVAKPLAIGAGSNLRFSFGSPDFVTQHVTIIPLIRSFKHKGLRKLFETGQRAGVRTDQIARLLRILDVLDNAQEPGDMNLPGYRFHALRGLPRRYAVSVSANWRLTFGWFENDVIDVDLEDYH